MEKEDLSSAKKFPKAGMPFLACGIVFFVLGLTMDRPALWAIGPAFIALGIASSDKPRQDPENGAQ
jgi:hypothetical protein